MGTVYAAEHEHLGRAVAVKILHADLTLNPDQAQRFLREAELVAQLRHPNIVTAYDFGQTDDGSLYYVMERLNGETLRARINRSPLADHEIREVFLPLLGALQAAHKSGIVHRDIKPANILLAPKVGREGFTVKLLDFGIAKVRTEAGAAAQAGQVGAGLATLFGDVLGTPAYMPPEQIKNSSEVDARADLYAVGVMLYESLVGQRPFAPAQLHLEEAMTATVTADLPGGQGDRGQITTGREGSRVPSLAARIQGPSSLDLRALDRVLRRALAADPAERYPDCASFIADLEPLLPPPRSEHGLAPYSDSDSDLEIEAIPPPRARTWWRAVLAGALAVGLIGGWWWQDRRRASAPVTSLSVALQRAEARIAAAQAGGPSERSALLEGITAARCRVLRPFVEQSLSDEHPGVWQAAVQSALAVGERGDRGLLSALQQRAQNTVGATAVEIAAGRFKLGDSEPRGFLVAAASSTAMDASTRVHAAWVLVDARLASPAALRTALQSERAPIRPAIRRAAQATLLQLRDEATRARLSAGLDATEPAVRLEAASSLALAGDPAAREQLLTMGTGASAPGERILALTALAEIGEARAIAPLLALIGSGPDAAKVRPQALSALTLLSKSRPRAESSLRPVFPYLTDPDPATSLRAALLFGCAEQTAGNAEPAAAPAQSTR
jgi:serine/threonine protein kinase